MFCLSIFEGFICTKKYNFLRASRYAIKRKYSETNQNVNKMRLLGFQKIQHPKLNKALFNNHLDL